MDLPRVRFVTTLLEFLFLVLFWAWVLTAALFLNNSFLPRLPLHHTPEQFGLPAEPVTFHSTDGLALEGWKIAADPSHPWIILCHGLGSNRGDLLDIAQSLFRAGFNLFLFDFRGHGGSDGQSTSFGWYEQRDLEGALAWLGQQEDVPARPYGVYGISMGGAVALTVAGYDERLGAIAVDSPYENLDASLTRHLFLLYPWLPRIPFAWFVQLTYRVRFGIWPQQVSPATAVQHLHGRPLLLIQGSNDSRMPLAAAKHLFEQATQPKELWVIDGARHLEGFALQPDAYRERLIRFFRTYFSALEHPPRSSR